MDEGRLYAWATNPRERPRRAANTGGGYEIFEMEGPEGSGSPPQHEAAGVVTAGSCDDMGRAAAVALRHGFTLPHPPA